MPSVCALRRLSRGFGARTVDPGKPNEHHRASIRPSTWLGLATRGIVPRYRHRDVLLARRSRTANRPRTARTPCQTDLSGLPRAPGMPNPRPHRRGTLRHLGWHVRDRTRPPRPAAHPAACPLTSATAPLNHPCRSVMNTSTGGISVTAGRIGLAATGISGHRRIRLVPCRSLRSTPDRGSASFGPDTPSTPSAEPGCGFADGVLGWILASR